MNKKKREMLGRSCWSQRNPTVHLTRAHGPPFACDAAAFLVRSSITQLTAQGAQRWPIHQPAVDMSEILFVSFSIERNGS
jgi:hypothetical protein